MVSQKIKISLSLICLIFIFHAPYSKGQGSFTISTVIVKEDTFVDKINPILNYGNNSMLKFGTNQTTYLKFNLEVKLESLIEAGISLYLACDSDKIIEVFVSMTDENWDEYNIIWNNRPRYWNSFYKFNVSGSTARRYEIDITHLIDDNCISICLYTNGLNGSGYAKEFSRQTLTDAPHLTLIYQDDEPIASIPFNNSFLLFLLMGSILIGIRLTCSGKKMKIK